jgi:tRNA A-37 threonylcarbamoyl transferase component Bud32
VPADEKTEILPPAADDAPPARPSQPRASLIGRSLGKFTIVEMLGRGGSGEVYRAEQTQLGRSAVIKVLRHDVSSSHNRVERFLREAKLASRLDHPYAAHVYAFGAETDGVLWIAMEHVKGETLDAIVLNRGPMPPAVFGPLFARLCEVVHTAHELGIIHRDIKGSNVMVIERAGQLLPKLLDFGIAKGIGGDESPGVDDDALTGHGSTLGSPHYMAPEQWEAPAGVDARADIYALGVLAYRCIAGELPFKKIPRAGLAEAHLSMPPPMLPALVPTPIAEVIYRALAKQRESRWANALALGEAMRAAAGGVAPEAVPAFDMSTLETWSQQGPQPIADAVVRLSRAATTVEADVALRELVAITCRWYAVLGLAQLEIDKSAERRTRSGAEGAAEVGDKRTGSWGDDNPLSAVREKARAVTGRDDAVPWLQLARAAAHAAPALPGLSEALVETGILEALAQRLDDRDRKRTAAALAADIAAVPDALLPLERLLAYQLVVGRAGGAESWQGVRRRDRERVVVWGEPLAEGTVALLDAAGRVVTKLSPLVQVISPLPSSEPELFLLWKSGRGAARLVAAPWGFERDDEAAAQRLSMLTTHDSDTLANPADDKSPYPGLHSYGVEDADRFVGREREIESLANRLVRAPMVAVLGPSGAGKSSFIHAGLLPRLAENYEIITMRPGRHPLHVLAALPAVHADTEDGAAMTSRLRDLGDRAPRGLVIVIDQLEELVTLCSDTKEREQFAKILSQTASDRGAPVRVVVTLRDDFATIIESVDAFRGRFEVFVLATPPPDALRRIVTEPARRAQVSVDPRVVEDMVAEVAGRPASLPLLSFTASQLWDKRDRDARRITHEAYVEIGGVAGALSSYADHVYGSLTRRDQGVTRDLFSRLVSTDGTRIPAPRAELEQVPGASGVLAHLIDARLLVVREDDGTDIVEIVHECLATRWDRLARWRNEDAADRALLGDVRAAARRWKESGRRGDLLWHGEALAELRKLAARSAALTADERTFAEEADRAERRARKLRRVLVVTAMTMLGAVAVVMAYLGVAANQSRRSAEHSTQQAQSAAALAEDRLTASLVAQGRRELNDNRAMPALAYFGEAMKRGADGAGLRFMIAVASRAWRYEVLVKNGGMMTAVAASGKGAWLATADQDARVFFWNQDGTARGQLATEIGWVSFLQRMKDDRLLATGRDGIVVIDPAAAKIVLRIKPKDSSFGANHGPADDEIASIEEDAIRIYRLDGKLRRELAIPNRMASTIPVFDPTGHYVTTGVEGDVSVIDLVAMKSHTIAKDIEGVVVGSAAGTFIGYVDKQGMAHVHAPDGKLVKTFKPENRGHSLVIADAGDRFAVLGEHELVIHDVAGKALYGMSVKSSMGQFAIRGNDTWIAEPSGVIKHYREGHLVASLPSHLGEVRYLLAAGNLVVTLGGDGSLVMSKADAAQLDVVARPCEHAAFAGEGIATSYQCADKQHIYVGRTEVGVIADEAYGNVAVDRASGRAAYASKELFVFGKDKQVLAHAKEPEGHVGVVAFEDADHLLVAEPEERHGIFRWTISKNTWEQITDAPKIVAIVIAAGGIAAGTDDGKVLLFAGGKQVASADVGGRVSYMTTSGDRKWIAATLVDGGTAILDGATGKLARQLEPADALITAATLDATGELLIRPGRGTQTIWDRASGEALVFDLDLLADMMNATWSEDGRIEVTGRQIGILDIPRDRRPVDEIVREIACNVPLRVKDGKIEPHTPDCAASR